MDKAQWQHMQRRLDQLEEKLDTLLHGEEPTNIFHRAVGIDPRVKPGEPGYMPAGGPRTNATMQGRGSDRTAFDLPGAYVTTSQPYQRYEFVDPALDPGSWVTAEQMAQIDERFATYEEGRIAQMNEWSERNLADPPSGEPHCRDDLNTYGDAS